MDGKLDTTVPPALPPRSPAPTAGTAMSDGGRYGPPQQQQHGGGGQARSPRPAEPQQRSTPTTEAAAAEQQAYRPKTMSLKPNDEKNSRKMSTVSQQQRHDQRAVAQAVGELTPDDLPCPADGGNGSHEFVAEWTFFDMVASCFCCPCHTLSACFCTYLYRDPRSDSFDGAGCSGTGRKACVKCNQKWEDAEAGLVELKQRAAENSGSWNVALQSAAEPSYPATKAGTKGPVSNKDRLTPARTRA